MKNSRFIRLYETLSKQELRQLKLWINSPIHNQHKDVVKLFNYLFSRRKITKVAVQKKRVYAHLFPETKYDDDQLNVLMSYGLNTIKEFLGYNHALLNQFDLKKNAIQSLQEHKQDHLASLELIKTKGQLEQSSLMNAQRMLEYFLIEQAQIKLTGTKKRTAQINLPELFHYLTDFYCISTLHYACVAVSHSNVSKQAYHIPMLEAVLLYAVERDHPVVQLYYNCYQSMVQGENRAFFHQVETLFLEEHHRLSMLEQRDILLIIINYCIKQINLNAKEYRRKVFEWYKWGLSNGTLLADNEMSKFTFLNICSAGLKLSEYEWVALFIEQYAAYLPDKYRANYELYSTAKLAFYQRDYNKAQHLLMPIEFDDIFLNLDAKTMLLEIYYEENSIDALEALLISFSRYLNRKSVIAYHKKLYQNFIALLRKLLKVKRWTKSTRQRLLQEIEETAILADREWLQLQVKTQ